MDIKKIYNHTQGPQLRILSIVFLLSLITGLFITFSYELLAIEMGLAFILISLIIFTRDFTPILLMLIVLRPIVDIWTEYRIDFIGIQMVMTLAITASIIFHLITDKNKHVQKQILQDPVVILYVVYLLVNFLSFAVNPKVAVSASLSLIFRFISFLAMYAWGMVLFKSHRKRDWVISSYAVASAPIALFGYYQFATGAFHTKRGVLAIQATFYHPNMYANFLILANLACIYFILQKKYIPLNLAVLIANLFLFSQTYSRMALALWILLMLVLALVYRKKSGYFLVFVIIAGVVIFYQFPSIIDFWAHRLDTINDSDVLISDRSRIFNVLIYLFKQNPLIGIGPSTFWPHYCFATPHNEVLRNLAEVGILGTIPFIILWGIIFKRFASLSYFYKRHSYDNQKFVIFLMLCAVIIISITSNIGTRPELLWPLFLLLGGYTNRDEKGSACK